MFLLFPPARFHHHHLTAVNTLARFHAPCAQLLECCPDGIYAPTSLSPPSYFMSQRMSSPSTNTPPVFSTVDFLHMQPVYLFLVGALLADSALSVSPNNLGVRHDVHYLLHARGSNEDGTLPTYKNPKASIEDRVSDLLPRMTIEEKVAQM